MSASPGSVAARGLLYGLAFGLAVATVHVAVGVVLILNLGQPPLTGFGVIGIAVELAFAAVVGLVCAPALLAPRGLMVHAGLLALVWLALERWVAVDPSKPLMWLAGPLVGLALLGLGLGIDRLVRRAGAAVAVGALVNLALLAVPEVKHRMTAEPAKPPVARNPAAPGAPDVLFVVMDTVRAQSSSTYGYARETTPNLTKIAAEGLKFSLASSPGTWSLPAHASLFTGTFPSVHQAHDETLKLGEELRTIAEVFRDAGYETRCFSANPHISDTFGLTRGFDSCDEAWKRGDGARQFLFSYRVLDRLGLGGATDKGGDMVVGNLTTWMGQRPADAPPAFVFVNFLEAHFPFEQLPPEYRTAFQDRPMGELRDAGQLAFGAQTGRILTDEERERIRQPILDLYDGGVKYTDALVARVLDLWRARGNLDDTVVVVLADHGEVVGEHGAFGHLSAVVEEDLRVPLVFRFPKRIPAGTVVDAPVSTAGVFATLADLAGVTAPDTVQVKSLMRTIPRTEACAGLADEALATCTADAEKAAREAGLPLIAERFEHHVLSGRFAEGQSNGKGPLVDPRGRYRTYRSGDLKLVDHCEKGPYLFDLTKGEDEDLAPSQPETVARLQGELLSWAGRLKLPNLCDGAPPPPPAQDVNAMPKEERCSLCALGYLDGDACADCP